MTKVAILVRAVSKYFEFVSLLFKRRESFSTYYELVLEESIAVGVNSISLIALVSTFIGAVTTIQTAFNMTSPLIPKFVISQVVREMNILEIAPTIMAIIYAGKVGSSMAGGLGTMRITEQIDALEVMGINTASYLALPKVIASLIMYPLLVVVAGCCAIVGGYIVGATTGVVSTTDYIHGLQFNFREYIVFFALIKSVVFAFMVSTISCFKGYYTEGGALEVGVASTSAVTTSVIAILVGDYILAQVLL